MTGADSDSVMELSKLPSTTCVATISHHSITSIPPLPPPKRPSAVSVLARFCRHRRTPTSRKTLLERIFTLPPELHLLILSHLDFGELARMRRTCRFLRAYLTPSLVRSLLGANTRRAMHATCNLCLWQFPDGRQLVGTGGHHTAEPFSSRCVDCVYKSGGGLFVGRKYLMSSNVRVFVCRWCGQPVMADSARNQPEFHRRCFRRYTYVVFLYYAIGLAQAVMVLIASGLCWHYFRNDPKETGLVAASFLLSVWVFVLNSLRSTVVRTYHVGLILEAAIFVTWIYVLLSITRDGAPRPRTRYELATLVFILINILFRVVNVVGNVILACEYKLWRHKRAYMSPARSVLVRLSQAFVLFVEPLSVEQEYPARWWFRRRRPMSSVKGGAV